MSEEVKIEMKPNEVEFMRRMELEILPNRKNIDIQVLNSVAKLLGIGVNTACRTCAASAGNEMLNMYGLLKSRYDLWLFQNRKI